MSRSNDSAVLIEMLKQALELNEEISELMACRQSLKTDHLVPAAGILNQ